MNTPTPTSEAAAAAALPGSLAPPGLPDVAGLTQLASAFFAMLPGETMAAALPGLAQRAPSLTAALAVGAAAGQFARAGAAADFVAAGRSSGPRRRLPCRR